MGKLAYLGAPYSGTAEEKAERIRLFCEIDAKLMQRGIHTISPLHKHLLFVNDQDLPGDWAYWGQYSINLMKRCDLLIVCKLPGWQESVGLQAEIEKATELGLEIEFIS